MGKELKETKTTMTNRGYEKWERDYKKFLNLQEEKIYICKKGKQEENSKGLLQKTN